MYLESLELCGFKSFPDKIKLSFDKGITAVVGPNGSGKSNIGDAVRWVLGEQSSKTLRGGKMEDVIFAGTVDRKPVGYASVTLNIVNDNNAIETGSVNISVTRKLYRSGESEYRINGAAVRLKDVVELFMDTGLGRDGYSIIGQGRVAEIVSAKSGERREIFEEAAGITKLRHKKQEALRKLSAAEENLLRLCDILNELESRVEPLRIQSEKAAKFIDYSAEKKELEITVWVFEIEKYKKQLAEISDNLLINRNEYNILTATTERLEELDDEIAELLSANSMRTEELRNEVLETEKSTTQIHTEIAVCENDILHSKNTIAEMTENLAKGENFYTETEQKIFDAKSELEATQEKISTVKNQFEKLTEELSNAKTKQEKYDSKLSSTRTSLGSFYIKKSELSVLIKTNFDSKEELSKRLVDSGNFEENLRAEIASLQNELSETADGITLTVSQISETENRLIGLNKLSETKKSKLSSAKNELDEINFSLRDKEQRIKMLTELENNMEGFSFSVKQVLKAAKSGQLTGVLGTVANLVKVDSEYSVAIETALGAALQNIVVNSEDTAKRSIRFLKENKFGRATFLPITSVKGSSFFEKNLDYNDGFVDMAVNLAQFDEKYRCIFSSLLGRIVVAENIDLATEIAKKYGYKFKIVTLDGQVINAGGSFTGGAVSKSSGALTRKNDIERLTNESTKLLSSAENLRLSVEKLSAEADKFFYDIEGSNETLQNLQADKIRFEAEQKRIEAGILQNEQVLSNTAQAVLDSKQKFIETEDNIAKFEKSLAETEQEIAKLEEENSENDELRLELDLNMQNLSEELSSAKFAENDLVKDAQQMQIELERLENLLTQSLSDKENIASQIEAQNEIIALKEVEIVNSKDNLSKVKQSVIELNAEIAKSQSEHRSLEQKSNENRVSMREVSDKKENYSREITRLEEKNNSVQTLYDKIIADMSEQYEIYLTEALQLAKPFEDILVIQKELAEIKQKIRSLGNVNLSAIEEYEEVSSRYKLLSEQLSDVNKSKNELMKLIEELTDTMRTMFTDSFNAINENFKTIFVELFGGGKAELVLTDTEDVLESGIEIRVAPPGKVIKNLSLLSGGEQAFVAIAIYFSILRLKPSPFCILDEIEAALDDINVVKYAKYLREFTDTTQFILITHRRGSMDEADVLYGVTMQDKGISKILRLEQPEI